MGSGTRGHVLGASTLLSPLCSAPALVTAWQRGLTGSVPPDSGDETPTRAARRPCCGVGASPTWLDTPVC